MDGRERKLSAVTARACLHRGPTATFLSIPVELRLIIYTMLIRPDISYFCSPVDSRPSDSGFTTVLRVSCQIYEEAHPILDWIENYVVCGGNVYRNAPINPASPSWFGKAPPSELQFLRLRYVSLFLLYPVRGSSSKTFVPQDKFDMRRWLNLLQRDSKALRAMILKSKSLHEITLRVRPTRISKYDGILAAIFSDNDPDIISMLEDLVALCVEKKTALRADTWRDFNLPCDGVCPDALLYHPLIRRKSEHHPEDSLVEYVNNKANAYQQSGEMPIIRKGRTIISDVGLYTPTSYPLQSYNKVLDCRTCHDVFGTEPLFKRHLARYRKHRIGLKTHRIVLKRKESARLAQLAHQTSSCTSPKESSTS